MNHPGTIPSLDRALVWLRRDLRTDDHAALYHALREARQVWCMFIYDTDILDPLIEQGRRADRRVEFIHDSVAAVDTDLRRIAAAQGVEGAGLILRHGRAAALVPQLASELGVQAVYASHDDDPAAIDRDAQVRGALADRGVALHTMKDHVVFERNEVMTKNDTPFSVYTPYKSAWLEKADRFYLGAYPIERHGAALAAIPTAIPHAPHSAMPTLQSLGFEPTNLHEIGLPGGAPAGQAMLADFLERIDDYGEARNFPAIKGPSYLGVHLRFGTLSIRQLAREAKTRADAGSNGAAVWLSELIWRDFYHQVLHHHPQVVDHAFKPAYDRIKWDHGKAADARFDAWCNGATGYPLVDAAMRQINQSGYMHNRLRMVVASFLTKDLGLDWRRGEAYFALHLNDFELASNNGGWQWAASTGTDAQPYFRIFNPTAQSEKFDPDGRFIRRYLPQLSRLPDKLLHAPWLARPLDLEEAGITLGRDYPLPIVDHAEARKATLQRYAVVKASS
ncbi:MAG: deoxyribodipyrimidine photo-lyase [Rubrivivax sp.]